MERRRIDVISAPEFLADLADVDIAEIRSRRTMCAELDRELSYYRRLLHGRLDLLRFEQRRRAGEEDRSLVDALPDILGDAPSSGSRHVTADAARVTPPSIPQPGRRAIDFVLGDDFLAKVGDLPEDELERVAGMLQDAEAEVSAQRRTVQQAHDALAEEIGRRYRQGLTSVDDLFKT